MHVFPLKYVDIYQHPFYTVCLRHAQHTDLQLQYVGCRDNQNPNRTVG